MHITGFKLGRQFADGVYCKGYNALNLSNQKTVNIQVFDSSLVDDQAFVSQFMDITDKLVDARFGIMTPVLKAEVSSHACYMISEYFPAPQQLPATPPTLTQYQVLQFALQLAQTLDQLHKAGLVHGGIELNSLYFKTPAELMLRPVTLKRVIPLLRQQTLQTLEKSQRIYLAPEAHEGLTPATDFYALGVLIYHLLLAPGAFDAMKEISLEEQLVLGENRNLKPFLNQILAIDAGHRIQSLDQFKTALQQCDVELPDSLFTHAKNTNIKSKMGAGVKTDLRSSLKRIAPAAGLAALGIAAPLLWWSTHEAATERVLLSHASADVVSDVSKLEEEAISSTPAVAKQEQVETLPAVEILYQQAMEQREVRPQAALTSINIVLKHEPNNIQALKLKRQIEHGISVRSIINSAERQLEELKLLQPSGDNAYDSFQLLAEMLSPDDPRVQKGFSRIAAAYHGQAETLVNNELFDEALETVDLGLSIQSDYPPLLELRQIISDRKKVIAEQKLAQVKEQRQLKRLRLQQDQQRREQEQRQRELLQRNLEKLALTKVVTHGQDEEVQIVEQQPSQQEMQQAGEPLRQSKMDALLMSANEHLKSGGLSLNNVFSAHLDYEALQQLGSDDQRVRELKDELIEAYMILANRQNSDRHYSVAIRAIEQGVRMSPKERMYLRIESQLSR
jgi:serine/threonine protein kinase